MHMVSLSFSYTSDIILLYQDVPDRLLQTILINIFAIKFIKVSTLEQKLWLLLMEVLLTVLALVLAAILDLAI